MTEIWRPCYMPCPPQEVLRVSSLGRIESRGRLKAVQKNGGYWFTRVGWEGRVYDLQLHHLVLWTFVSPRPEGLIGAHKDGNPDNNEFTNLMWTTKKENTRHRQAHGTWGLGLDEQTARAILASTGKTRDVAAQYGTTASTVSKIRLRRRWDWL